MRLRQSGGVKYLNTPKDDTGVPITSLAIALALDGIDLLVYLSTEYSMPSRYVSVLLVRKS